MVSVFDGQLTRTWFYEIDNKCHVINLYHDTITGNLFIIKKILLSVLLKHINK